MQIPKAFRTVKSVNGKVRAKKKKKFEKFNNKAVLFFGMSTLGT